MEQSDLEAGENDAGVTVDVEMEPEPTPPSSPRSTADRDMDVSEPSPAHPLYSGAQIEEGMGVMILLSLAMRHKLTYTAFADIIKVINIHLPKNVSTPTSYNSVYRFLKSVEKLPLADDLRSTKIGHRLCGKSLAYLPSQQACSVFWH